MGAALEAVMHVWGLVDAGQYDEVGSRFSADATVSSRGFPIGGYAQARVYWQDTRAAFPDLRREIVSSIEEPDAVAIEVRVSGTNTGTLVATNGQTVPPTGKAVSWAGVEIVRLQGGLIHSWASYNDQLTLMQMLGLLG